VDRELPNCEPDCQLPTADCELTAAPAAQPLAPAPPAPLARIAAAFEVLLCSGFPTQLIVIVLLASLGMQPRTADGQLSAPFVFALTLLDTVLVVGLIVFFLRARGESLSRELFAPRPAAREIGLGIVLIPASYLVVVLVLVALQLVAPSLRNVPRNPLIDLVKTRTDAAIFAFVVMVAGGVREEIQRGFVLRRFEQYLGGGFAGLAIFSVLFGLGHLDQGRDVSLATMTLGAFWGAIFLARRTILAPMIGHAGFNLAQVAKFLVAGS
jgi:membrane protease YdiL (CAAX protease family)